MAPIRNAACLLSSGSPCTEESSGKLAGALKAANLGMAQGVSATMGTMVTAGVLLSAQDIYCKCMRGKYGTGGPECGEK